MDGKITGEDEGGVGISVVDHNEEEHLISVDFDGEITYHEQDAYPNQANEQTPNDAVNLRQAQWYAQYYVQRERGYPTLGPCLTPEWLPYTLGAVFGLSFDDFEDRFGPYAQQYHSALRPDVDPIVEMPDETAPTGLTVYRADVFLGLDFEAYLDDPDGVSPIDAVAGITDAYDLYETLGAELSDRLPADADGIEEVSALDLQYQRRASDGSVEEPVVGERSHTSEGPPDAQLQMTPPQTTIETDLTTEIIQGLVCHHLQCQVRDAYLRLGLEPPEPFRVLGQGLAEQTMHYQHADVYPDYHLTDADIDGYRQPGVDTAALAGGEGAAIPGRSSLTTRLKRALFGG
ncbi:hypothetical protein [Halovivax cerinus]|uniref:Uncharacterized protein n=1 Tax=Halovivax cerinus TaxID=1487865 RepID=A0ABD5NN00_9EURY|nr:hypothetical protein [Halovivax cerinus]